jgi:hypothetical protein
LGFSLLTALFRVMCQPSPKAELLKSVSDLSEASSKNSSGAFECQHHQHWEPSSGSCTSDSTNSRACLKKRRLVVDEASGWPTIYSILFVCYTFDHLPLLVSFFTFSFLIFNLSAGIIRPERLFSLAFPGPRLAVFNS